jgi:hypothetical protein
MRKHSAVVCHDHELKIEDLKSRNLNLILIRSKLYISEKQKAGRGPLVFGYVKEDPPSVVRQNGRQWRCWVGK